MTIVRLDAKDATAWDAPHPAPEAEKSGGVDGGLTRKSLKESQPSKIDFTK